MEIPKASEAEREYFRSVLPGDPDVECKPMFGNLGAFVNGNMFAGLFGSHLGVRLSEPDQAELADIEGAGPFGPAERPMGGYLSLPPGWHDTPDAAADWVRRAHEYVRTMPPKAKKPTKPKTTKTTKPSQR